MIDSYDAVIIGSGFGGAIPALRLAQAGKSFLVLEQGRVFTYGFICFGLEFNTMRYGC